MPAISSFEINSQDWDRYVNEHPKGSIFHTSAMLRVFKATPNHDPMFIAARNGDGKIVAILCAVRVNTLGGVLERLASRSIMYAEPICDDTDEGIESLIGLIKTHDRRWNRKTLFTEVRPMTGRHGAEQVALEHCGYQLLPYCNYVNDLSDGASSIAARTKPVQRKIRTAKRRGLKIKQVSSENDFESVYRQIQVSYGRSQIPVAPNELFHSARKHLPPEMLSVRLGSVDGQNVAASVGLVFKDRYFAWFNGTTRPKGIAATASLVWDEIEEACQRGIKTYDFGGAGWPEEEYGPRIFKSRFGGTAIDSGRYRKVGSQLQLALARGGFGLVRRFLFKNEISNDLNDELLNELNLQPANDLPTD